MLTDLQAKFYNQNEWFVTNDYSELTLISLTSHKDSPNLAIANSQQKSMLSLQETKQTQEFGEWNQVSH